MITTLAWVVLLTALTRPLRLVWRHESSRRKPLHRLRPQEMAGFSRLSGVRQTPSYCVGNVGILPSYARYAAQESGEIRDRQSGIRDQQSGIRNRRSSIKIRSCFLDP